MKSLIRSFAILASLSVMFGCQKEEPDPEVQVSTAEVTEITDNSALSGGEVVYSGKSRITAYGVCWSTKENPTIADEKTEDGDGTGSFVSEITGLQPGCTYYVRAYAVSSKGVAYGGQKSFSTGAVLATVTTTVMSDVTFETAVTGGVVTADGGSEITTVGVCWGTTENPDIEGLHTEDELGADGTWTSTIDGLEPDQTYYVRAYAVNEIGVAYGNQVTFGTSTEPVIETLTDAALWAYVLQNYDLNNDGKIQISEAELVTVIDCPNANVATIEGIAQFTNLRDLRLNGNALTSVDLSGNPALEIFWGFANPELTSVDISGLSNMQYLHCQDTKLASIDLSSAVNMTELNLYNTQLTEVDVTYCAPLQVLNLQGTPVTKADVSNKTALWYLNVRENENITELAVQGCSALRELYVDNTSIAKIDASGLDALQIIWAFNMRVENVELIADNCPELKYLHGYNDNIELRPNGHFIKCSAKNCPNLIEYRCFGNPGIKEVDFSGSFMNDGNVGEINLDGAHLETCVISSEQKSLTYLNIHQNRLQSLDLSNMPLLAFLHCGLSTLKELKVNGCNALSEAYTMNNPDLTALDFSGCGMLRTLWAFSNPSMTTLNVEDCKKLYYLDANSSGISNAMVFTDMPELWYTVLWGTNIPKATYSNVPVLEHFNYENAPLTELNISGADKLEFANVVNTQLTSLDMSGAPGLCRLAVRNTKPLASVTLTSNPLLHSFWGWDTSLESLDFRGCATEMKEVMVDANPNLKTIYLRGDQVISTFNKDAGVEVIVQ